MDKQMKVYVASSWRNQYYDDVLQTLRELGLSVYDFRNPESAFNWGQVDPGWMYWSPAVYMDYLSEELAV